MDRLWRDTEDLVWKDRPASVKPWLARSLDETSAAVRNGSVLTGDDLQYDFKGHQLMVAATKPGGIVAASEVVMCVECGAYAHERVCDLGSPWQGGRAINPHSRAAPGAVPQRCPPQARQRHPLGAPNPVHNQRLGLPAAPMG